MISTLHDSLLCMGSILHGQESTPGVLLSLSGLLVRSGPFCELVPEKSECSSVFQITRSNETALIPQTWKLEKSFWTKDETKRKTIIILYLVRTRFSKIEPVTCKILTFLPKKTGIKLKTMQPRGIYEKVGQIKSKYLDSAKGLSVSPWDYGL